MNVQDALIQVQIQIAEYALIPIHVELIMFPSLDFVMDALIVQPQIVNIALIPIHVEFIMVLALDTVMDVLHVHQGIDYFLQNQLKMIWFLIFKKSFLK